MATQIQLRFLIPANEKREPVIGMFLSFLSAVAEVTEGSRKSTYLNQFYRERLDKKEKRVLSAILGQLLQQLNKMNESSPVSESIDSLEEKLPQSFLRLLKDFSIRESFDFEGAASFSSGSLDRQSYRTESSELDLQSGGESCSI